ncbi:type II toxin-antitoxin system RelE/ParE family toxin [Rodentibacter pneumotropicus]|uniref:Type II toxin-antitoxin system RelE/ParE family toxin n=1 Tax=Rodentibacter pneumotropicus TaxID=758 RepID=A0A4S2QLE2_9PAST|nr:type II toxin-antitoxin system RelE/ParE family toxin [Rodentibacter pneumotropicus]THA04365.1 type II toxin-antitoxin system RelE/ParE family toxin [Rodentibacter pneumotropicus]THA17384.1 type II toxin-antitoxin system RelE/ParE family toxin [Rodentibacter pneumotropicus]
MNYTEEIQPAFTVNILTQTRKVISKMPLSLQEKIYFDLDDLAVYGNELQEPKVRDLGDSLKELRTSAKDGIARSFFFFYVGKQIYVIHAIQKKTQKTPKQDLDLAKARMRQLKEQLAKENKE